MPVPQTQRDPVMVEIVTRRRRLGISAAVLACLSNVPGAALPKAERGIRGLRPDALARVIRVLDRIEDAAREAISA